MRKQIYTSPTSDDWALSDGKHREGCPCVRCEDRRCMALLNTAAELTKLGHYAREHTTRWATHATMVQQPQRYYFLAYKKWSKP